MASERRQFPRLNAKIEVTLSMPGGAIVRAATNNISSAGLQLQCDAATATQITPNLSEAVFTQFVEVKIECFLPIANGEPAQFVATGKVMYFRRSAQETYQVGVSFLKIDDSSYTNLRRFFERSLGNPAN